MTNANLIIVGNSYLFDFALKFNKNIIILYSVVDERIYKPQYSEISNILTVGWIGSPSTTKYLFHILDCLEFLSTKYKIQLVTIGASKIISTKFDVIQLPWSLSEEVFQINKFDVGVMPLQNNQWERGKCGFKLIQYMACGKPVIASPVGINNDIVTQDIGFLANTKEEWVEAFTKIFENDKIKKVSN